MSSLRPTTQARNGRSPAGKKQNGLSAEAVGTCLTCTVGTYPAQLTCSDLANIAYECLTRGIAAALEGEQPIKVVASTKNRNLGFEVPCLCGSESRRYLPDFIVLVHDGHGSDDPLLRVVEIKGYRRHRSNSKLVYTIGVC